MNYCNALITFFSGLSQGEVITAIGIIIAMAVGVATIAFIVWWDRRKKHQERIDAFIEPLLQLKTIIETKSIPDRASYEEFITNLFAEQDRAMSVVRNRMDCKTKATFDKKWAEYKEEREPYKNYWDTNLSDKFSIHKRSDQLIVIIDELINIAKKI